MATCGSEWTTASGRGSAPTSSGTSRGDGDPGGSSCCTSTGAWHELSGSGSRAWQTNLALSWVPLQTPGQVQTNWGHGGRGLANPDKQTGATQHFAGIGRCLVPCYCSGRFRCKVQTTEAENRTPHTFNAKLDSGYFFQTRGIKQTLALVLTSQTTVANGRISNSCCSNVKSLDSISTSPSFSNGVSPLRNAWFYSGTCYASVWKLMEAFQMFKGVVKLDPEADTQTTLQRLIYDHADARTMYS